MSNSGGSASAAGRERFSRRTTAVVLGAVSVLGGVLVATGPAATGSAKRTVQAVTSLSLVGHGYGPGIGMGQWGDFGYAVRYHLGYEQILQHFYGGTKSAALGSLALPVDPTLAVAILENVNLKTNVGYDPVVTSAAAFTVTGQAGAPGPPPSSGTSSSTSSSSTTSSPGSTTTTTPQATGTRGATNLSGRALTVPGGAAIDLRLQPDGTWSAYESTSCSGASAAASAASSPVATGLVNPVARPSSSSASAPVSSLLSLCRHDGVDQRLRGSLEAYDRAGYERTLNLVPLESYVAGVVPGEVSASWGLAGGSVGSPQGEPWGFQALEAQAVAVRSYVLASSAAGGWQGYADICDTDQCQAYVGAAYETVTSDAAVTSTAGEVRVSGTGSVISARFSASTGGWTAPSAFPAVQDLGDACVVPGNALECNPVHTWRLTVSGSVIAKSVGRVGQVESVVVRQRNRRGALGGRALVVVIQGTRGTVTDSGDSFAASLGLRSDWFAVSKVSRQAVGVTTGGSSTTTLPTTSTTSPPTGAPSTPPSTVPLTN
ncbi:MAG: SpoIID/LytB domain protein [Acidimicrobiaceae bacterium]|nr:SpoIID/LytB domain protein [Acidimicrobiaceae bacterium]